MMELLIEGDLPIHEKLIAMLEFAGSVKIIKPRKKKKK